MSVLSFKFAVCEVSIINCSRAKFEAIIVNGLFFMHNFALSVLSFRAAPFLVSRNLSFSHSQVSAAELK